MRRALARTGGGGASGGARPQRDVATGEDAGGGRAIVCRECGRRLARSDEAVSVAGSHTHTFMNPGGFVFEIACYRDAPGTRLQGTPSAEWSWFPGCTWQIACCTGCDAHVGWRFHGASGGHHGLVRDRITEEDP
jgi:hypothetical protein